MADPFRAIHIANGSISSTPIGLKSRTLRVATINPRDRAMQARIAGRRAVALDLSRIREIEQKIGE